jgi:4-amino-4-deoxychorismate lyase
LIRSMCRLIETIKISDGKPENIFWHNQRFNTSRQDLFGIHEKLNLETLILIPEEYRKGEVKCRIGYGYDLEFIEFEPYIFRPVRTLQLVYDEEIQYKYKFSDRSHISILFSKRGANDDILIVKNGLICESSHCNVVFSDGEKFFTPSSPLLKGTKRAKYLAEGKIQEKNIRVEDIHDSQEIHLINAFLDLGSCVVLTKDL